ncbi:MAG: peptidoglycan DD-metalloendopeptidase family protein [Ignavibacteriales bacterium]|nr:peptidoglycan DD-metalloendopeptidase family protein [Ignavibacteriales bacterium]
MLVSWQIRNNGTGSAGTSNSQVRITTSNASNGYGNSTNNVGSAQATGTIGAGATINQSTTVTVPSTPGTYYVWVIADNNSALTQTNYTNDYAVSAALTAGSTISLSFPLTYNNWTAYTAEIVTVFDHAMTDRYYPGGGIISYADERGTVEDPNEPPVDFGHGLLYSFKKTDGSAFQINGHYVGTITTGATTLNYDGHPGYDYRVPIGTDVFAAADGSVVVADATNSTAAGNYVRIQHGTSGYQTQYLHLSQLLVTLGQQVNTGQLIGKSGNTAGPSGSVSAHLHFEVKLGVGDDAISVDPYGWQGTGSDPYTAATNNILWLTARSNVLYGIDVSHWQNDAGPITWSSVYNSGIRFVFVKASESYDVPDGLASIAISYPFAVRSQRLSPLGILRKGTSISDHFLENIQGSTGANLIAGAYHLTRPDFPKYPADYTQSAIAEAEYFLSRAGNYIGGGSYLPAALDVESNFGLSASQLSQWIRTWFQFVQQQKPGTTPVLYTARSILLSLDNDLVTDYHLWIATDDGDPTGTPSYSGTSWANWKFKQYRFGESGGTVNGVTGPVDLDSFNGTLSALIQILPVELSAFLANVRSSQVQLSWRTETEINNYGFEIERRVINDESARWKTVGFVAGSGSSNSPHEYSFTDHNLTPGRYAYRIKQIDRDGTSKYYGNAEVEILAPSVFALHQNYPNPFNPSTTIRYELPSRSFIRIEIFNILGQRVAELLHTEQEAGYHSVEWRANAPSGVYLYRIEAVAVDDPQRRFTEVKRMLLLR